MTVQGPEDAKRSEHGSSHFLGRIAPSFKPPCRTTIMALIQLFEQAMKSGKSIQHILKQLGVWESWKRNGTEWLKTLEMSEWKGMV